MLFRSMSVIAECFFPQTSHLALRLKRLGFRGLKGCAGGGRGKAPGPRLRSAWEGKAVGRVMGGDFGLDAGSVLSQRRGGCLFCK